MGFGLFCVWLPPLSSFTVLGIESGALPTLGKHPGTEIRPQPSPMVLSDSSTFEHSWKRLQRSHSCVPSSPSCIYSRGRAKTQKGLWVPELPRYSQSSSCASFPAWEVKLEDQVEGSSRPCLLKTQPGVGFLQFFTSVALTSRGFTGIAGSHWLSKCAWKLHTNQRELLQWQLESCEKDRQTSW